MNAESLRQRPLLTGVLLGLLIRLVGTTYLPGAGPVAFLFFGGGAVLALFAEDRVRVAGRTLFVAGTTVMLLPILGDVLQAILDEIAPSVF